MELKDLIGEHTLDAVDFSTEDLKIYTWSDFQQCSVMRFRLDGTVYSVIEDPSDGYRSAMSEISVSKNSIMTNIFPPLSVIGRHNGSGIYGGEGDILELVDAVTGEVVLEAGTDYSNDYYPSFVANFNPEAMKHNK